MKTNKGKRTNAFIEGLLARITELESENKQLKEQANPAPAAEPLNPQCTECNEVMARYQDPNTGQEGWGCDSCGWSWDDA